LQVAGRCRTIGAMPKPLETLTIADIARLPRPGMVVPGMLRFTPDSRALTYLFSAEGSLVRSLWRLDIASGERRVIAGPPAGATSEEQLSREEELRRQRLRLRELGVTSYQWAARASSPVLLVPDGGQLSVAIGDRTLSAIPGTEGALDPKLNRDGSKVAFARDGDLFVTPTAGGEVTRLTHDAADGITNGVAEFIAAEELDRDDGFWWSPGGDRIAFIRADSRHIPRYPIVHQGKSQVDIEEHRYPFTGAANALLQLGVIELETGACTWMDLGTETDFYIPRVAWRPDGTLTCTWLSRDQQTIRLLAFDATGTSTVLIEEHQEPWINIANDARFLDTGEILWWSERSGFGHLYCYDAAGLNARQLTSGEWVVTRVVSVHQPSRTVYFEATRETVLERHLYAASLDGGDIRKLTGDAGWHSTTVSGDGRYFVDHHSSLTNAPRVTLRAIESGEEVATIFANDGNSAEELGLHPPELVDVPAADGSTMLKGAIYAPPAREPGKKYPVIVSVYGGPHAQRVADDWSLTVDLRAQYLAQEGFVVFRLDNRGSANRGLEFEAALALRMGTVEVEDQAAGVRWLESLGYCDTSRTGMFGWSYGGYMTVMSMLREPEVFKVGVSGAPVADWDGYDTGYTERYMSTPALNPDGYRDGSLLKHADRLQGKLLLVHGGVDENVHFRHTARLITALTDADRDYDLLIFPEERHMPHNAKGLEYQERKLAQYFERELRTLPPGQ